MSSDEEMDELRDLENLREQITNEQLKGDRMQVSAWDDDEEGIEETRNAKDPIQKAVLEAGENGQLDVMKRYHALDPSVIDCADKDGYTPLHRACYGNHTEVVEFLLKSGAKIDAKTQDEWQPLHSACYWNNVDCASILIQHGADINAKSKGDQTPLHLVSASSHNSSCLQLLLLHPDINPHIKNSSGDTAYEIAKRNGKYYPMFEIIDPCLNEV
ncbi:PREDICTED: ankyrin repeat domain-containing protein 49-like [Ceratosolen solmsi marchali]|uniref:Ankyrin repeat domain-containing protein 49-like n=1 Tax=Ceratosolen solmsi marchali TaxID=326594 RepID=A0AAJ6YL93_9HYME|nr:PREDICTED: ankyrin repeat domain-containing protein 49-like [Ceratosolen solmsi marchali]